MKYRAEIDGLRALAVLPVILFHAGFEFFSGGYVGVDVFFVISGYLITTILIDDIESNRFSIVNFYERRARRILPALVFVLFLVAFISWLILLPNEMRNVYQQLLSNSFFLSNFHYTLTWDYFELWRLPPVLLNTWSLAVEEQFYVFIPLLLLVFKKKTRAAVIIIISLTLASILSMFWLGDVSTKANYYLLPSRFWELAVGVLLAYATKFKPTSIAKLRKNTPDWMQMVIVIALLIIFTSYTDKTPYPSTWTLPAVFLSALAILLINTKSLTGRLLANRGIVYVGKISYPLYLIHFPAIILFKTLMEPVLQAWQIAILAISFTFLLSVFTFHYIESPFRTRRVFKTKLSMLSVSVISLSLIASLGLLGHFKILESYSAKKFPELAHLSEAVPFPPNVSISDCAARNSYTQCNLINDNSNGVESRKFLIVGDSFAANLISPIWMLLKDQPGISLSARITFACSFMPNGFASWDGECGKARSFIESLHASEVTDIIFHINFVGHLKNDKEFSDLESLTNMFSLLAKNKIRVHVIGAREVFNIEPTRTKLYPWLLSASRIDKESATLNEFYYKWSNLGISVYKKKRDLDIAEAYKFYLDKGHLSKAGSVNFMSRVGINSSSDFLLNK